LELVDDPAEVLQIVRDFTAHFESSMPAPWSLDASAELLDTLVKQIVGFRVVIERLEGKWKLNQNHPPDRRRRVVAVLQACGDENSVAIARLMDESL